MGRMDFAEATRPGLRERFDETKRRRVAEFRYEVPEDLWKYWAI